MHTVERLEACLEVARQLGYGVRREWMGGVGGGACELRGRKWLFIDLALSVEDQLELAREALRDDPGLHQLRLAAEARRSLGLDRAA